MGEEFFRDIPRLYTALAEFFACIVYILVLKKRFMKLSSVALCGAFAVLFGIVQIGGGSLSLVFWIPVMIMSMVTMIIFILSLCKEKVLAVIYFAARAFVLAEFAAALVWQIYHFMYMQSSFGENSALSYLLVFIVYGAVFTSAFLLERRYQGMGLRMVVTGKDLFAAVLIAVVIFTISNLSFVWHSSPLASYSLSSIFYIRTLVDLCGVILMFAQQEQRLSLHARREVDAIQKIFSHQYDHYVLQKDNLERLNLRYHDFKHQIAAIRNEQNEKKRNVYLEEMENDIKIFEANYNTGDRVLDTLLAGKGVYCAENGINFTCVADGEKLKFMDVMDTCSIVGNALDNAVESVEKIVDEQKRLVKVAIFSQNDLVILKFENYIESEPDFVNGLPKTTKNTHEYHGYGLKSIKGCAEKYGGIIQITTQDNWFVLSIVIPFRNQKSNSISFS